MKKISSYCLFVIFIFTMHSCKKDPGGTFYAEPEPVFSVAAKFGISDVLIEAGRDDFYMFTSYDTDSLDVLIFKGELNKLENCLADCEESLSISIRDAKVYDPESSGPIDVSALKSTGYGFVGTEGEGNEQTAYEITFTDRSFSSEDGESEIIWQYPSSSTDVFESAFSDVFESATLEDGIPISLTSVFGGDNGCTSTFEKVINADYQTDCFHDIDFNIVPKGDGVSYQVLPYNADAPEWEYTWDNSSFVDTLTIASPGTYCLTVTNSYGCTGERCVSISNLDEDPDSIEYCYAAFSYEVTPLEIPDVTDLFDFSKILITYRSKDGAEYRSDRLSQPESSFFIIESLDDYDFNEFQEATIKLDAKFRVVLYNESGEGVLMNDGEATIGVAIPN